MHPFAITLNTTESRFPGVGFPEFVVTSSNNKTGGQPFEIPFPWSRQRLVEIVNVENDPSFRSSKATEIHKVTITAHLDTNARSGRASQIGGHDRSRASIKSERTLHHPSIPDWDKTLNAPLTRPNQ